MAHVFISYHHSDFDFVEIMNHKLEEAGFNTWMYQDGLQAGEDWRETIDDAIIRSSFALIVIMTPEAKASEYVTYEWSCAWGAGIKVVPVLLKTTKLHPRLEAFQYEDFTNRLRPWDKLIKRLKEIETSYRDATQTQIPISTPLPLKQAIDDAVVQLLVDIRSDDPYYKRQAIKALGAMGSHIAIPNLIIALYDAVSYVRKAAAETLGMLGNSIAIPGLIDVLHTDDIYEVQEAAADALVKIGKFEAIEVVEKWRQRQASYNDFAPPPDDTDDVPF